MCVLVFCLAMKKQNSNTLAKHYIYVQQDQTSFSEQFIDKYIGSFAKLSIDLNKDK